MEFGVFTSHYCPALTPEPTLDQIEETTTHGLRHRATRRREEPVATRSA